jgi:hypothetical protein
LTAAVIDWNPLSWLSPLFRRSIENNRMATYAINRIKTRKIKTKDH